MLPNLLVIGAQKAGTTALHSYLRGHPDTFMSQPKELKFFIREGNWDHGLGWYEEQFAAASPSARIRGESSPDYTRAPRFSGVPERIHSVIPDVRLIYVVRRPIDRIRSSYQHALVHGVERRPIDEAVRTEPGYLDDSRYAMQIDRYLQVFDRAQLLVLSSDTLRDDRLAALAAVSAFLDIDPTAFRWARVDQDVYASRDRKVPNRVGGSLLTSRWADLARSVVPEGARRRVRPHVERDADPDELVLAPETERWITEQLADDQARLTTWLPQAARWSDEM